MRSLPGRPWPSLLGGTHPRNAGETVTFTHDAATAAQFRTLKDVRFIGVLSE